MFYRMSFAPLFLPLVCFAEILFHSNLESERMYSAHALKPGAKKIELLYNPEIPKWWPENGGEGIIEPNYPQNRELFRYLKREGRFLQGVSGLKLPHAEKVGLTTGGLSEWFADQRETDVHTNARVFPDRANPVSGLYSARIECDHDSNAILARKIQANRPEKVCLRFLLRLSEDFAFSGHPAFPVARINMDEFVCPWVSLFPTKEPSVFRAGIRSHGVSTTVLKRSSAAPSSIRLDTAHCIELLAQQVKDNQVRCSLWVDSRFCSSLESRHHLLSTKNHLGLSMGKAILRKGKGRLFVDEIVVSDRRIGRMPGRPQIAFAAGELASNPHADDKDRQLAVQWQIATDNSWLPPWFNSGLDTVRLSRFSNFQYQVAALSSFPRHMFETAQHIPLGLPGNTRLLGRVRYRGNGKIWGPWSRPTLFSLPKQTATANEAPRGFRDAWFSLPGKSRPLQEIRKGDWYDLHMRFIPPGPGSYCDLYLNGNPETCLENFHDRGGPFRARDNYVLSISLPQNTAWAKQDEGRGYPTSLMSEKGLYCDDTPGKTLIESGKGKARIRIRVLRQAREGQWLLTAFMVDSHNGVSRFFTKLFQVSETGTATSDNRFPGFQQALWLFVGLGVLGLFLASWAAKSRKRSKSRTGSSPESVVLENDPRQSARVQSANQYILENYHRPISLQDVADAIGVSANWLSKTFKQGTGKNVSIYLSELRVEKASKLLRETTTNASDIAFQVGFNTVGHFNRTFRQITGQSPSAFRKSLQ